MSGGMMQNMSKIMEMQKQAKKMEKEMEKIEEVVEKGDFRVVINGKMKILDFTVQGMRNDEAIKVLNEAIEKAQKASAKQMQSMAGGLSGLMEMMK